MATTAEPLSPPAPESQAATPARRLWALDAVVVALALALAFLTASFPATNSDLFGHLASGRLLAEGRYRFGRDPFAYTTEGAYWVNHAWLFDLLLYGAYLLPGAGAALVVLKALLAAALAGVLILAGRRSGEGWWLATACAALAVLALSPRLLLQPVCVSYLFLGVTVWLLQRPRADSSPPAGSPYRVWWLLPPLFALWVNLDDWFLLGPAAVALYLAGEVVRSRLASPGRAREAAAGAARALALVLAAGVAACLLNPHHARAFALPWDLGLSPAAAALARDGELGGLFRSPVTEFIREGAAGVGAARLAYFVLAGLGLVAFAVNGRDQSWGRLLVWLGALLLSLANGRCTPFFAIVAGPITARNLLDFAARRPARTALRPETAPALTAVALAVLSAATVPGWLQGRFVRRHVGWAVQADPSLERAARCVRRWREQGLTGPGARLFNTTPDLAYYLAWYCPGEEVFQDLRLPLFPDVTGDFVRVRAALGSREVAGPDAEPAWRGVFRRWHVRYLAFHTADPRQAAAQAAWQRLLLSPDGQPGEWTVCYADGRTVLAGWKDRDEPGDPFAGQRLDVDRLAFGPEAERAPAVGPAPAGPRPWWSLFVKLPPARPLAADEALLQLARWEALGPTWAARNAEAWEAASAASVAATGAAPWTALLPARIDFGYRALHGLPVAAPGGEPAAADRLAEYLLSRYLGRQDAGPPASLYLAVRAARRAVAEAPDDARAYLLLGQAYLQLAWRTRERAAAGELPHVALLRQAQAAAALRRATTLDPDLEQAHGLLADLYGHGLYLPPPGAAARGAGLLQRRNLEAELLHRREQVRCARRGGPQPGEAPADFVGRLAQAEKEVSDLGGRLRAHRDRYEVAVADKPVRARAEIALDQGLVETALSELLAADVSEWFTAGGQSPGAARVVELLLADGRAEEAGDLLTEENRRAFGPVLGLPGYGWFRLERAAAAGDYRQAEEGLAAGASRPAHRDQAANLLAMGVGQQLFWEAARVTGKPWPAVETCPALFGMPPGRLAALTQATQQALGLLQQESDLEVLGGLAGPGGRRHGTGARALRRGAPPGPGPAAARPSARRPGGAVGGGRRPALTKGGL